MGVKHQPGCREIAIERQSAIPGALLACALLWFTAGSAHGETLRQAVETAVNTHPRELFTARSNLAAGRYDDLFNHYAIEAAKGTLVKSLGIAPARLSREFSTFPRRVAELAGHRAIESGPPPLQRGS